MRLTPEQRSLIGPAVDRTNNKSLVAKVFGITRKTLDKWNKRRKHLKELKCIVGLSPTIQFYVLLEIFN